MQALIWRSVTPHAKTIVANTTFEGAVPSVGHEIRYAGKRYRVDGVAWCRSDVPTWVLEIQVALLGAV